MKEVFVVLGLMRVDQCDLSHDSTDLESRANREFRVLGEGGSRAGRLMDTLGQPNRETNFNAARPRRPAPRVKVETFVVPSCAGGNRAWVTLR